MTLAGTLISKMSIALVWCADQADLLNTTSSYEPIILLCRVCVKTIYTSKGQKFANKEIRKAKAEARK